MDPRKLNCWVIILKPSGHAQQCQSTVLDMHVWFNLSPLWMSIHIQKINLTPLFFIKIFMIYYFGTLLACLPMPDHGISYECINQFIAFMDVSLHTKKATSHLHLLLRYDWKTILQYFGHTWQCKSSTIAIYV